MSHWREDIKKRKSEKINILKRTLNIEEDFENESEEINSLKRNNSHNVEMNGENEIEEDDDTEDGAECDLFQI